MLLASLDIIAGSFLGRFFFTANHAKLIYLSACRFICGNESAGFVPNG
jgi:hypothetical protein